MTPWGHGASTNDSGKFHARSMGPSELDVGYDPLRCYFCSPELLQGSTRLNSAQSQSDAASSPNEFNHPAKTRETPIPPATRPLNHGSAGGLPFKPSYELGGTLPHVCE